MFMKGILFILLLFLFKSSIGQNCKPMLRVCPVDKYCYSINIKLVTGKIEVENNSDSIFVFSAMATGGLVCIRQIKNGNSILGMDTIKPHSSILFRYSVPFDKVFDSITIEDVLKKSANFKNGKIHFSIKFAYLCKNNQAKLNLESIPIDIVFTKENLL